MLDIIIPCYNSHKTLHTCLGSLVMQNNKDFCVTLVNDCGKPYDDIINMYKALIDIKQITYKTNMGPGYARQYGIDNTNNKYIMFMDSDDCLVGPFAIDYIVNSLHTLNDCGILNNGFYKEYQNGTYKTLFKNFNFLHAKVFNREFLNKYNIRFMNSSCCEDASFTLICDLLRDKQFNTYYTDFMIYCWIYNRESLGRKDIITWEHKTVVSGYVDNLIYAFNHVKQYKQSSYIDMHKIVYMIRLVLIYADTCKYFPQFEDDNLRDLKRYFETIYKPIQNTITPQLFSHCYNQLEQDNSIIKQNKILRIIQLIERWKEN